MGRIERTTRARIIAQTHRTHAGAFALGLTLIVGCGGSRDPRGHPPEPSSRDPLFGADAGLLGNLAGRLGPTVTRDVAPPPISGGSLVALRDGATFVAADPDRDQVWLIHRPTESVRAVTLAAGDEPGRVIEGPDGVAFVALRRGGTVLAIDVADGRVVTRHAVCPAPRGLAWDGQRAEVVVACAGGELASIAMDGTTRMRRIDDDLRDVVLWRGRRFVSRFRRAELLEVDHDGQVLRRDAPPEVRDSRGTPQRVPGVAWRTIAHPTLGVVMLHQLSSLAPIALNDTGARGGAYGTSGSRCVDGLVSSVVTSFHGDAQLTPNTLLPGAILAVDLAAHDDRLAVATPGNAIEGVVGFSFSTALPSSGRCATVSRLAADTAMNSATSVTFDAAGAPVLFLRDRPWLLTLGATRRFVTLPGDAVSDTGHAVFHFGTPAGLACASCHPEGGDDGRVWRFTPLGDRRTPPMRGATSDTAPFHWDGDMADIGHLLGDVFARRMSAGSLRADQQQAVARWIDGLPTARTHATADVDTLARGRAVFEGPAGCADCHAGESFTNGETVDVGTGGRFQVPQLRGLAARAPYLHDGRAATLDLRIMMNDGDRHGHTSGLTPTQRADLLRYLESI